MSIDSKRKKDILAIVLISGTMLVFCGVFVIANMLKSNGFDKNTLCAIDAPPVSNTIIIVDKSDIWDPDDASRVQGLLSRIASKIPAQGRLTIMAIVGKGRETTELKTFFDMCSPGSEKECNELYQNCNRIVRRYRESFIKPLENLTKILMTPGQSSFSPLFETIVQVIDGYENTDLNVHIISDLMENGRRFRFYDVIPLAEEIVEEYPLSGKNSVSIHAHVIERRRHSRQLINAVQSVWEGYFVQQRVVVAFQRLLITE